MGVLGEMSYRDFRLLAAIVADLGNGGVWLNIGSSVIMPEVFLKALSVAQNLGYHVDNFTTANFDMIQHYRPTQNVVRRPTQGVAPVTRLSGTTKSIFPFWPPLCSTDPDQKTRGKDDG